MKPPLTIIEDTNWIMDADGKFLGGCADAEQIVQFVNERYLIEEKVFPKRVWYEVFVRLQNLESA